MAIEQLEIEILIVKKLSNYLISNYLIIFCENKKLITQVNPQSN